jgi:hypothetical protein
MNESGAAFFENKLDFLVGDLLGRGRRMTRLRRLSASCAVCVPTRQSICRVIYTFIEPTEGKGEGVEILVYGIFSSKQFELNPSMRWEQFLIITLC